jgi:hypothetical protein
MPPSFSEKIPLIRPYWISLIPQGFHGVHPAGAQGWDIPGGTGNGRQVTFSRLLFWMWNDVFDAVGVAGNGEIKRQSRFTRACQRSAVSSYFLA